MTTEAIELPTHWPPRVAEVAYWLPESHPARIALGVNPRVYVGNEPRIAAERMPCQCCSDPSTVWRRVFFDGDGGKLEPGNWVAYCDRHKQPRGK